MYSHLYVSTAYGSTEHGMLWAAAGHLLKLVWQPP
eukprot:COSAG01_NODE_48069_length_384_cov_0.922807_2_plen_34_part_01